MFTPFSMRKKSLSLSVKRAIKCPSAAMWSMRCCNSFLLLGEDVSMTTFIWFELTLIHLCVTMNPRNLPALTPKAHLAGLSFMLYALIRQNVSSKC